jgi:hypothetical protein
VVALAKKQVAGKASSREVGRLNPRFPRGALDFDNGNLKPPQHCGKYRSAFEVKDGPRAADHTLVARPLPETTDSSCAGSGFIGWLAGKYYDATP